MKLVECFGDRGMISDAAIRRIWVDGGVSRKSGGVQVKPDDALEAQDSEDWEVEFLHGGGGLAMLGAANTELGITKAMAEAAVAEAKRLAEEQDEALVFESAIAAAMT